jgi:hypothetical protein
MSVITDTLANLRLEAATIHANLAVFPLVSDTPHAADYLTLDQALARNAAHVSEVSESGSVPELFFDNASDERILLADGEELVGAKQNRILNISILVGAQHKVRIPVSCVEAGRWHYRSRAFGSAGRKLFAKARASKSADVTESLLRTGSRRSDQSKVWADIEAKMAALDCASPTAAMADIYEQRKARLDGYATAFKPCAGQVGAVFAVDGRIAGVELYDSDETFARFLGKLVGSYALDAIESDPPASAGATLDDVRAFLARLQSAASRSFPSTDLGEDLRWADPEVTGGALVYEGRVVHLSAFAPVA